MIVHLHKTDETIRVLPLVTDWYIEQDWSGATTPNKNRTFNRSEFDIVDEED